jgi:hypothetical protein
MLFLVNSNLLRGCDVNLLQQSLAGPQSKVSPASTCWPQARIVMQHLEFSHISTAEGKNFINQAQEAISGWQGFLSKFLL